MGGARSKLYIIPKREWGQITMEPGHVPKKGQPQKKLSDSQRKMSSDSTEKKLTTHLRFPLPSLKLTNTCENMRLATKKKRSSTNHHFSRANWLLAQLNHQKPDPKPPRCQWKKKELTLWTSEGFHVSWKLKGQMGGDGKILYSQIGSFP